MKKLLSICLVICMALTMVIGMVACKPPQHEHQIKKYWNKDSSGHWKECADPTCKDKFESADHQWNDGEVVVKASSKKAGKTKYTCTICKFEKTEDTPYVANPTVTEQEWKDALYISNECLVNITTTIDGVANPQIATIKVIDDMIEVDPGEYQGDRVGHFYVKSEDGKYYDYELQFTYLGYIMGQDWFQRNIRRTEIDQIAYENNRNVFAYLYNEYSNFTYDQTTSSYKIAQLQVSGLTLTDVEIVFADKLLAEFTYTITNNGSVQVVEYDFSYNFYFCNTCRQQQQNTLLDLGDSLPCSTPDCKKLEKITADSLFGFTNLIMAYEQQSQQQPEGGEGSGDAENAG